MTSIIMKFLDGTEHQGSVHISVGGKYPDYVLCYYNRLEHPKVLVIAADGQTQFVPTYNEVNTGVVRIDEAGK